MPKYYTAKDLIKILGLSKNTIYNYLETGKIKSSRIGNGGYRISTEEVARLTKLDDGASTDTSSVSPASDNEKGVERNTSENTAKKKSGSDETPEEFRSVHFNFRIKEKNTLYLFDWLTGLSAVLLGFSILLLPNYLYTETFIASRWLVLLLGMVMLFAGLLYLFLGMVKLKEKKLELLVKWVLLLGFLSLSWIYFRSGMIEGMILYGSLFVILSIENWWNNLLGVIKFVVLVFFMILGNSLLLGYERLSIDGIFKHGAIVIQGMPVVWEFLYSWVFLIGSLLSIRKKGLLLKFLLFTSGLAFTVLAFILIGRGVWDRAAIYILLGVFSFLFPFYEKFERFEFRYSRMMVKGFIRLSIGMMMAIVLTVITRYTFDFFNQKSLNQRLVSNSSRMQDFVDEAETEVRSLAESKMLEKSLVNGDIDVVSEVVIDSFRSARGLMNLVVLDKNGIMLEIYPHTEPPLEGQDFSFREFFQKSVGGEFYISDLYESVIKANGWIMMMSSPIYSVEGDLLGVVAGKLDFSRFNEKLDKNTYGRFLVFDKKGRVMVGEEEDGAVLADGVFWSKIQNDKKGSEKLMLNDKLVLVTYQVVPDLGWTMVVIGSTMNEVSLVNILLMLSYLVIATVVVVVRLNFLRGRGKAS